MMMLMVAVVVVIMMVEWYNDGSNDYLYPDIARKGFKNTLGCFRGRDFPKCNN